MNAQLESIDHFLTLELLFSIAFQTSRSRNGLLARLVTCCFSSGNRVVSRMSILLIEAQFELSCNSSVSPLSSSKLYSFTAQDC